MSGPEDPLGMLVALGVIFGPQFPLQCDWRQALEEMPRHPDAIEPAFAKFKYEDNLTYLLEVSFDTPEFLPVSRRLIAGRVFSR